MMTFREIQRDLQARHYAPVYFLEGEESYFIDTISNFIENTALSDAEKEFNQIIFYGKDCDVQMLINTAKRYPMMAERQVVILKEAQQMNGIEALLPYLSQPSPSTILVINYKFKNLDKRGKLYKALDNIKNIVYFDAKKINDREVPDWIQELIQQQGLHIDSRHLALLAEYLGNNLAKIESELQKLFINVATGDTITAQHIETAIGISREYNLFELQKALAERDLKKTYRIMRYFSANAKNFPPQLIIGSLYNFFSKLYIFHAHANKGDQDLQHLLDLRVSFAVREYRQAARHFNLSQTRKALALLLQYDLKSKGYESDAHFLDDESLLLELINKILN